MNDTFQFTAAEWQHVSNTLDAWADVLAANDDRQHSGGYFDRDDEGNVRGMCALGALVMACCGEAPLFANPIIDAAFANPFILDLVGRTAARQNGITDLRAGMARHDYDACSIAYLNDIERLTFVQIACAVKHTRDFLAEHVVIVEPQPAVELVARS